MVKRLPRISLLFFGVSLAWFNYAAVAETQESEINAGIQVSDEQKKRFVGEKTIVVSGDCRPSDCDRQCQQECEVAVEEKCESIWEVCTRCLQQHPLSPEEAEKEGIWFGGLLETCPWCFKKYPEVFEESRCTFNSSEHAQSMMGAPIPKDVSCYITCR